MIPFIQAFDFSYGRADQLSGRITRVIANNPGPFTFTGSGSYLVGGKSGIAVIDPGPDDHAHVEAILAAATGPITHILVTHTHIDHCGGTDLLKAATGAEVLSFGPHAVARADAPPILDEGADFGFHPDTVLVCGDKIRLPDATLTAVHTPGHCANHLCFALEEESALFTGDHIMGWATSVIAPPDGDMDDYMASLDLLLARQDETYYPTHGALIPNPEEYVSAVKAHRLQRDAAIFEATGKTPASTLDIAKLVYTELEPSMLFAAALNVEAHLMRHVKKGTVIRSVDGEYSRG